jgi:hypothetical protein
MTAGMIQQFTAAAKYVALAVFIATMVSLEYLGFTDRLPPSVTCEGLRALRGGMTEDEVRQLLGGPVKTSRIERLAGPKTQPFGELWDYSKERSPVGGLHLTVHFFDKYLVRVAVFKVTFSQKERVPLFLLIRGQTMKEEPDFKREVCDSPGTARLVVRRIASGTALTLIPVALLIRKRRSKGTAMPDS